MRQATAPSVRASWTAYAWGPFGLSIAVSAFLGFVGAFGSAAAPLWSRMAFFVLIGIGAGVLVAACVLASQRIAWLAPRPWLRRAAIALVLTPLCALWVWAVVGFAFQHGPRLALLPGYLGYSLGLSVVMTLLSWAIFRPRAPAPEVSPSGPSPKFQARLPLRLRDSELYAVQAEDHYLRVRTSKGSDLILMRLSDALSELSGLEGAQTHRSWWVAKAGLADVRRAEGRAVLMLKDGAEVPVSRTHARTLRALGWF